MKYIFLSILFLIFISCRTSSTPSEKIQAEHFNYILYDNLSNTITAPITRELENNYSRILDDLQVSGMPEITIKIWGNYNNFLDDMEADIGTRYTGATGYIYGPTEMRIFLNSDIPHTALHEFCHLVSLQLNPNLSNNPRWLWEAVALYFSGDFINPQSLSYMVSGDYPALSELNSDFNNGNRNIYQVGYVLLEYIKEIFGTDKVIELIQNNGNLQLSLGMSQTAFENGWYSFIEENYLN